MKKILQIILLAIISAYIFCHCSSRRSSRCNLNMDRYDYSFGIDYDHPGKYLTPGRQSDLNDDNLDEIRTALGGNPPQNFDGLKVICQWYKDSFDHETAGGAMIGLRTINELYESKMHYGCHSQALILSSVLREFGFPTIMVETSSIKWAYKYRRCAIRDFSGHVMTEVFVEGRWILLDNTCTYVENYDCRNPFISMAGHENPDFEKGMFVYAKGIDMWAYCIRSVIDVNEKMIFFADNIVCFKDKFNTIDYTWKSLD